MRGATFRGDRRVFRFLALLPAVAACGGGSGGADAEREGAAVDVPADGAPDETGTDDDGAPDSPAEADGTAAGRMPRERMLSSRWPRMT